MFYDLIIIGGGMSGISVGHFFRNKKILILEKGKLLSEASGKNAGFLIAGFGEHFRRTVSRLGLETAREIQEIHRSNHRRIREASTVLESQFERTGSLSVASGEAERFELIESHELLRQAGYDVEWQEAPQTGLHQCHGAILNKEDALIDPLQFWNRLATGLAVRSETEVLNVENQDSVIRVETSQGAFLAEKVVYCLDAFASFLIPELEGRYIPLRGQLLETAIDGNFSTLPVITDYGNVYWRFHAGKLILGGLESIVPEEEIGIAQNLSLRLQEAQLQWIADHLDVSCDGPVRSRFSTMAYTLDGFPFVGRLSRENRYVLSGTCGLGHSYTMEAASWLYELIENDRNVIPAYCSSDRIATMPVHKDGDWRKTYEAWNY